jgi:hypothetical protein
MNFNEFNLDARVTLSDDPTQLIGEQDIQTAFEVLLVGVVPDTESEAVIYGESANDFIESFWDTAGSNELSLYKLNTAIDRFYDIRGSVIDYIYHNIHGLPETNNVLEEFKADMIDVIEEILTRRLLDPDDRGYV